MDQLWWILPTFNQQVSHLRKFRHHIPTCPRITWHQTWIIDDRCFLGEATSHIPLVPNGMQCHTGGRGGPSGRRPKDPKVSTEFYRILQSIDSWNVLKPEMNVSMCFNVVHEHFNIRVRFWTLSLWGCRLCIALLVWIFKFWEQTSHTGAVALKGWKMFEQQIPGSFKNKKHQETLKTQQCCLWICQKKDSSNHRRRICDSPASSRRAPASEMSAEWNHRNQIETK